MGRHTPGPWTANGVSTIGVRIDSLGEKKTGLNFINGWVAMVRDRKDVPLISAAPDLLDELERTADVLEGVRASFAQSGEVTSSGMRAITDQIERVDRAIAKATGPADGKERT